MKLKQIRRMLWQHSPKENFDSLKNVVQSCDPLESFDGKHHCIFVLSTGRVGTQTLSALCGLSNLYIAHHEPSPKLFRLGKKSYENKDGESVKSVFQEAFLTCRIHLFENSLRLGKGYVETSPQATFLAEVISEVIPQSRFIHLVRHPKMVIRSAMRRGWYNGSIYDHNRIVPVNTSAIKIKWSNATCLQKNIWLWAETNRWILDFEKSIAKDRFLRLYSEQLMGGDSATAERLYSFMNCDYPRKSRIKRILSKNMNKQTTGKFPEPYEWTETMDRELVEIAGQIMDALNYC